MNSFAFPPPPEELRRADSVVCSLLGDAHGIAGIRLRRIGAVKPQHMNLAAVSHVKAVAIEILIRHERTIIPAFPSMFEPRGTEQFGKEREKRDEERSHDEEDRRAHGAGLPRRDEVQSSIAWPPEVVARRAARVTLPARMSNVLPSRPRQVSPRRTFALVASDYNQEFVRGLSDHAQKELRTISPNFQILNFTVPGAFEIPILVQELAAKKDIDAIIALGVIIEGETQHAALIGQAVTHSLQQIALSFRVPVIHEVLLVKNAEQARKRCLEDEINRGTEAARVAAQMVKVLNDVRVSLH